MKHRKYLLYVLGISISLVGAVFVVDQVGTARTISFSEIEGVEVTDPLTEDLVLSEYERELLALESWVRPKGPMKVALQAGHWKANEAPEEFPNLRSNTGTSGGGTTEWEINLKIANETKKLIEEADPTIVVEVLPATIPPDYWADVFVAIHADGNLNSRVSGYKIAAPRRDLSGMAEVLASIVGSEYASSTKLVLDPNVTRNMRGYYAFNWRRYEHALHPRTVGVILETGFLTNAQDRKVIVAAPEKSASGVAAGVMKYLDLYVKPFLGVQ